MMKPGGTGWNDPPKLSHQVHTETKSRKNLLNKRVPYMSDSSVKSHHNDEALLPDGPPPTNMIPTADSILANPVRSALPPTPPLNIFVPNTEKVNDLSKSTEKKEIVEKEVKLLDCSDAFISSLLSIAEECKTNKNVSASKDIEKKLEILKKMVNDGSLSDNVVNGMKQLTLHLLNKEYEKAWDIHVSLMCDHVSEVRLWMVGVKRLINELRNLN